MLESRGLVYVPPIRTPSQPSDGVPRGSARAPRTFYHAAVLFLNVLVPCATRLARGLAHPPRSAGLCGACLLRRDGDVFTVKSEFYKVQHEVTIDKLRPGWKRNEVAGEWSWC